VKDVGNVPGEDHGKQDAKDAGAEHESEPRAGSHAGAAWVFSGLELGDILGDAGLDTKVEIADVGAHLEDKNPGAVSPYWQFVGEIRGQEEGDGGGGEEAADAQDGVAPEGGGGSSWRGRRLFAGCGLRPGLGWGLRSSLSEPRGA